MVDLRIDWASYAAAKYACENWHYSECMPVGKLVKIGVWEDNVFIGVVIFGRGANNNMLKPFNLKQDEGCELTRVALNKHKSTVTKIISISLKLLKKQSPKLKLVVSYADSDQGHIGSIYQAGNWIFDHTVKMDALLINGKKTHRKTVHSKYGFNSIERLRKNGINAEWIKGKPKYRYLMPLDKQTRKKIEILSKPYPKRGLMEEQQVPPVDGGSIPTSTLHIKGDPDGG